MSAHNNPPAISGETCSHLESNPLACLSNVPWSEAFFLFNRIDGVARDVYGYFVFDTSEHDPFMMWMWTNVSKLQSSITTVQLVADYFEAQRDLDMMYDSAHATKQTLELCNYVLDEKDELNNKSVLATVYKVKITALTKLPEQDSDKQDSYGQAVIVVEEAASQGYDVAHWDVFKSLDSCLTDKGLDTLTRKLLFYKPPTKENRLEYDACLIKELNIGLADSVSGPICLVLCHSAAPTGAYFRVPTKNYCVLTYGGHGTLTNTRQGADLLNSLAQSGKLPECLAGDTLTTDPNTGDYVEIPDARLKSLVENSFCPEQPIHFKPEKEDASVKASYVAAGWPNWDGLYHYDPKLGLTFLKEFAEHFKIRDGTRMKTSDVVAWITDNDVKADTLVIKGCNVVHKISRDLRKRKHSSC